VRAVDEEEAIVESDTPLLLLLGAADPDRAKSPGHKAMTRRRPGTGWIENAIREVQDAGLIITGQVTIDCAEKTIALSVGPSQSEGPESPEGYDRRLREVMGWQR
jgi:hypothetical protein